MLGRRTFLVLASAAMLAAVACASFRADDAPPPAAAPPDDAADASDAPFEGASEGGPADATPTGCDPMATVVTTGLVACSGAGGFTNDLSNDGQNCGRCGHDCLGAPCVAGLCQPITIFDEPAVDGGLPNFGAFVIGVAGGYVYWGYPSDHEGSATVIRRGRVDGSGPLEELGPSLKPFAASAVDEKALYYSYDTDLFVRAANGGVPQRLGTLPTTVGGNGSIALSADQVYVADGQTTVSAIARNGGSPPTVIKGNASSATWLVVDGAWLGWLEAPWETDGSDAGAAIGAHHLGMSFTVPVGQATALTAYGGAFYWFDVSTHRIDRLVEGGPPKVDELATVPIVTPARRAHGLVVDGSRAFLGAEIAAGGSSLQVFELSLCGGTSNVRTPYLPNIYSGIVGDETAIYWGTYDQGIRRMAK